MNHVYLLLAILFEVVATSALKETEGFTRPGPTLFSLAGYGVAFYFLSLPMRSLPVGVVYAIWSGVGIVLITLIGRLLFRQPLDLPALLGIALIVAGVVIIHLFSETVAG